MTCPDCGTEMSQTDTTTSTMITKRATCGQHTGNIYSCAVCDMRWLENLLNGGALEVWHG